MTHKNNQPSGDNAQLAAEGTPTSPVLRAVDQPEQSDPRWPYQQGPLAADEKAGNDVISVATAFIAESAKIRRIQLVFLVGACLLVAALAYLLFCVVETGFKTHITTTEDILVKAIENSKNAKVPATLPVKVSQSTAKQRKKNSASDSQSGTEPSVESAPLFTLISTGITAITSASVAIVSILVIAISVITIAVGRSAFSLSPQRLNESQKTKDDPESKPDSGYAIPGLEFAKEIIKMTTDLVRGGSASKPGKE